jgi:hypothetical protein
MPCSHHAHGSLSDRSQVSPRIRIDARTACNARRQVHDTRHGPDAAGKRTAVEGRIGKVLDDLGTAAGQVDANHGKFTLQKRLSQVPPRETLGAGNQDSTIPRLDPPTAFSVGHDSMAAIFGACR